MKSKLTCGSVGTSLCAMMEVSRWEQTISGADPAVKSHQVGAWVQMPTPCWLQ